MIKYLLIAALLILSVPFWLPSSVGGSNSYHFVLTDSMKGTIDPGAFVVVRRMETYNVGDVVAYRQDLTADTSITILHRIVGRLPDGRYLLKGDAVAAEEQVEEEAIKGRMVAAVPGLGFLPGAFRHAPLPIGGLMLALVFVGGRLGRSAEAANRGKSFFLPAALIVLAAFPFASVGLAASIGKGKVLLLLLSLLGAARLTEVQGVGPRAGPLVELSYILTIVLAVSTVSLSNVIQLIRTGIGL